MTTLQEMLAKRPVDPEYIKAEVQKMHEEARLYRLKEMRKETGITQQNLAKRLGVAQNRISQIENGKIASAQVGTLQKYVEALGGTLSISIESPDGTRFDIPAGATYLHSAAA